MKLLWYRSRWDRVGDWLKKQCFRQISYRIIVSLPLVPPIIIDVAMNVPNELKRRFNCRLIGRIYKSQSPLSRFEADREMYVESAGRLLQRQI